MRTEFNLGDFNMVVWQRDKLKDEVKKLKRKTFILSVSLVTSLIIGGDLATRLYHTERALEMEQQRVEVLEVQASDTATILEVHDQMFFEYIESGYIQGLDSAVEKVQTGGTQQGIENMKGGSL